MCPVLKRESMEKMFYILIGWSEGIDTDWYINLRSRSPSGYIALNVQINFS
jgi:hypothetical protein